MADTRDLSSLEGNFVWVQVPYPPPDDRFFMAGIKYVFSNYSEEDLKSLIASCTSIAELGRKLGLSGRNVYNVGERLQDLYPEEFAYYTGLPCFNR